MQGMHKNKKLLLGYSYRQFTLPEVAYCLNFEIFSEKLRKNKSGTLKNEVPKEKRVYL